jgi:hypothetical protein
MAERSNARVYGRSLAGIAGSNPNGGMDGCPLWVLSGRGLCDGLITRREESYRLWCVLLCDLGTSRVRRLKLVKGCKCRIEKEDPENAHVTQINIDECIVFLKPFCSMVCRLHTNEFLKLQLNRLIWGNLFVSSLERYQDSWVVVYEERSELHYTCRQNVLHNFCEGFRWQGKLCSTKTFTPTISLKVFN